MKIEYIPFGSENKETIKSFINGLYNEEGGEIMSDDKIRQTIDFLSHNPQMGQIIIICADLKPIGYSILINYWSNEFGGIILFIDELYICDEYRNKGIGSTFIRHLIETRPGNCTALAIEVWPMNHQALKLYNRIGFVQVKNHYLRLVFKDTLPQPPQVH